MTRSRDRIGRRRLTLESLESRRWLATYFVDPVHGDDAHDGRSRELAFRTPLRLVSQYSDRLPAGHISLVPGDVVIFTAGTLDFFYHSAVSILQSSHIVVVGFDIRTFGLAGMVAAASHVTIREHDIHDVDRSQAMANRSPCGSEPPPTGTPPPIFGSPSGAIRRPRPGKRFSPSRGAREPRPNVRLGRFLGRVSAPGRRWPAFRTGPER